jgi:hypothetical protein
MLIDYLTFAKRYSTDASITQIAEFREAYSEYGRVSTSNSGNSGTLCTLYIPKHQQNDADALLAVDVITRSAGLRCRRIDIAMDVLAPMPNLDPAVLSGWIGKAGVPETLYVGSRQYRTFWRIYDKRKEILSKRHTDIGFDVTRYELEAKGKAARAIWPYLVDELKRGNDLEKILSQVAARFDKNHILPVLAEQADLTIFDAQYESSTWAWYTRHKENFLHDVFNNDAHSIEFEQDCISFVQDTIMRIANERDALVRRAVYENN